jgi:outer membrane protein assembly factor BamB
MSARMCDAAERKRRRTVSLAAVAILLSGGIYFTLSNFLLPHSVYAREVVAIDRQTGFVRWTARCNSDVINGKLHAANTMATPTPVTDGEHVFAHFGEAGLFCLDMKGDRKWKFDEPVQPSHWGAGSSPILWKDLVIMTYDTDHQSMTVGVDKATGVERWRSNRTSQIEPSQLFDAYATPIIIQRNGEEELVHLACKLLAGYEPATGKERWTFAHTGEQPVATPVISDDLIIVLGGQYTPYLAAVRIDSANNATAPGVVWQGTRSLSDMPSPVVYGGLMYMVTKDGIATCVDAQTGEYKWRHRLKGAYWSSVTAAHGNLYFCNASGTTTVIAAGPMYKELNINALGENVKSSFAVSEGEIFVRTTDNLICIATDERQ